jgi:hypothetical protein
VILDFAAVTCGRFLFPSFSRDYWRPPCSKCYEAETGPESPEGGHAH